MCAPTGLRLAEFETNLSRNVNLPTKVHLFVCEDLDFVFVDCFFSHLDECDEGVANQNNVVALEVASEVEIITDVKKWTEPDIIDLDGEPKAEPANPPAVVVRRTRAPKSVRPLTCIDMDAISTPA